MLSLVGLFIASCGTSHETTDSPVTAPVSVSDAAGAAIEISALFDGAGAREAIVAGFVVWDNASARFCETLMESYPAQCGGMWVVIADPDRLSADFDEAQGVRWTPNRIDLAVAFDGNRLFIDATTDSTLPTDSDEAVVDAFLAFAARPSAEAAANMPLATEVALGLGPEITAIRGRDELSDLTAWRIDRDEFRAWAGPFSALDFAEEPVTITVGANARCGGAARTAARGVRRSPPDQHPADDGDKLS